MEFQARYPYPFDPFQVEAMRALARGSSVLVAAPTGTGKTVIAEFGVFLARQAGLRAIYTTPIKALSNQKYRDFKTVYGDQVGLLTGDVVVNSDGSILVMTTEVLRNMVVQLGQKLENVGAIVFDEVHYVGDRERGTAWEEAILLAPPGVPLICLSATVPNVDEIAAWLRATRGQLECIVHEERAVPLEHRYYVDGKAHLILDAAGRRRPGPRGVGGELAGRYRRSAQGAPGAERQPRAEPQPWEVVRHLEQRELTPAIYFLFSRRACEAAAESCAALGTVPNGSELAREARARLVDLPREDRALRQVALLLSLLPRGVAVHHAGLLPVIKILVEELFAAGRLRAVFATDTLALGINMPARTVVLGEMSKWDGEQHRLLTPNEYRQMTGRAGRRGIDERGLSLILYSPWVSLEQTIEVVQGGLLPLESAFAPHYSTAVNLWHQPADRDRLAELYARSLRRFQHDTQLEELTEAQERLRDQFEARANRSPRDQDAWRLGRELGQVERELSLARRQAAGEARVLVDGLSEVLDRFGYLERDRPGPKAELLRQIFDSNALTLAELLAERVLEALPPEEVAEVVSWFAFDRESPLRSLPIPRRLQRLQVELLTLNASIVNQERRLGLSVSEPLNEDFRGITLAWAQGRPLGEIADRARLAEGDLVGVLQKTLDLLGQLRTAVTHRAALPTASGRTRREAEPRWELVVERLRQADALLRRGVVEASYRWAIAGPPNPDRQLEAELEAWPLPRPTEERSERRAPGPRAGRAPSFRRGTRSVAAEQPAANGRTRGRALPGSRKPRRQARTGGPPPKRGRRRGRG